MITHAARERNAQRGRRPFFPPLKVKLKHRHPERALTDATLLHIWSHVSDADLAAAIASADSESRAIRERVARLREQRRRAAEAEVIQ